MYLIVTELCIRTLSEEIKDLDSPLHCATQGFGDYGCRVQGA